MAGAIRLAEPRWCDCWSALGANPPPSFKANLKLVPAKAAELTFDPVPDAAATSLIACLTPKIAALPVNAPTVVFDDDQVRYSGLIREIDDPQLGVIEVVAAPISLSRTSARSSMAAIAISRGRMVSTSFIE